MYGDIISVAEITTPPLHKSNPLIYNNSNSEADINHDELLLQFLYLTFLKKLIIWTLYTRTLIQF